MIGFRRTSINLPVAMRYRQLKETFKHAVGVYPSSIHGRGLFCLRDIDSGEMVIEYAGEVSTNWTSPNIKVCVVNPNIINRILVYNLHLI